MSNKSNVPSQQPFMGAPSKFRRKENKDGVYREGRVRYDLRGGKTAHDRM